MDGYGIYLGLRIGVYNYATGEKYEGEWADGKIEGKGILILDV